MDDTDRRLIALLRDNARLPVATLAHRLKVSRGTVQNRIDRLTADGEMTIGMKKEELIDFEVEAFTELIDLINAIGLPPKKEPKVPIKSKAVKGKTKKA